MSEIQNYSIEDIVEKLAEPIAVDFGVYIWDVDFSKDILSVYIARKYIQKIGIDALID